MPKYKVGDSVWCAKCRLEPVKKVCPTCFGKKQVTLILGNGDQVVLPCQGCVRGFRDPCGFVQEYENIADPKLVTITKIAIDYHSSQGGFSEEDLFPSQEEAAVRAVEKKINLDAAQRIRAELIKEKVHKSFSWNAHYHLKQAELHASKAVLCQRRRRDKDAE